MKLKSIIDEDFINYKKSSMMLVTHICDWKCLKEQNLDLNICQNHELSKQQNIEVFIDSIIDRYLNNLITKAIVIGGLEPFLQFDEILEFIKYFRQKSEDDIVIYTGYYPDEIANEINQLKRYKNIIIKFGRYIHESDRIFDDILGVWLVSSNQFATKIS